MPDAIATEEVKNKAGNKSDDPIVVRFTRGDAERGSDVIMAAGSSNYYEKVRAKTKCCECSTADG